MREVFMEKIKNKEYISNYLYLNILENNKDIIPINFNVDTYNDEILERDYLLYKDYFDNMYKGIDDNIHLDKEQIKAILADEDYSLIIAGAGTGKTTTMASKVKYLVDIKGVDPSLIAVMSYTKKATLELEKRIVFDFGINANVTTFHSLGLMYIRQIFNNRKCYVVDKNLQNQIFLDYFKEKIFPYKDRVLELFNIFDATLISKTWVFGKYFRDNYNKYKTFDEYFANYKKDKILEIKNLKEEVEVRIEKDLNGEDIYTIKKELVKSKGEALIANYLFCNGIEYKYEKVYQEVMEDRRTYRPDFTLRLGSEDVYLEYFGLSTYKDDEMDKYNKIRIRKENYHKMHHTRFIALDNSYNENMLDRLKGELIKMGFVLKPLSYEEIFDAILDNNPTSQFFPFKDFLYNIIKLIKSSSKREYAGKVIGDYLITISGNERSVAERQFYYIKEFYSYYQNRLFGSVDYGFDFSDMIYYANKYINKVGYQNNLNFEYLIIDEYQDISQDRYLFTKNMADRSHSKVVAVGDDWQSIYAFAGSNIKYIYNFQKYFKGSRLFSISRTYRNSQELIDYSGMFVMKNKDQIRKELVSNKDILNPIRFVMFDDGEEYQVLKRLILKIHNDNPTHNIMVLARTNEMIDTCYQDPELKDDIGTKIEYVSHKDIYIDGMTIHKSKGLTSDEVILIGLNQSFPHSSYGLFWMESLFKYEQEEESIPFAEERRIFYVGLTRTKNYVYLLVNKNPKLRSPFINEIYQIIENINSIK